GGGRLTRADLFGGLLTDADVTIQIGAGSLSASYDGRITTVNLSIALSDERYDASLTGAGHAEIAVTDLLVRSPGLLDHSITTQLMLEPSRVGTIKLDTASLTATLAEGTLQVAEFHGVGPLIDLQTAGRLELDGERSSQLDYTVLRGDLALVKDWLGRDISGDIVTRGQL